MGRYALFLDQLEDLVDQKYFRKTYLASRLGESQEEIKKIKPELPSFIVIYDGSKKDLKDFYSDALNHDFVSKNNIPVKILDIKEYVPKNGEYCFDVNGCNAFLEK